MRWLVEYDPLNHSVTLTDNTNGNTYKVPNNWSAANKIREIEYKERLVEGRWAVLPNGLSLGVTLVDEKTWERYELRNSQETREKIKEIKRSETIKLALRYC